MEKWYKPYARQDGESQCQRIFDSQRTLHRIQASTYLCSDMKESRSSDTGNEEKRTEPIKELEPRDSLQETIVKRNVVHLLSPSESVLSRSFQGKKVLLKKSHVLFLERREKEMEGGLDGRSGSHSS